MKLHKLGTTTPIGYTTWGCMWKQGQCKTDTDYECINKLGNKIEMQTRITAYWSDGSVKWTAHTANAAELGDEIEITPVLQKDLSVEPKFIEGHPLITETTDKIIINTDCYVMNITKDSQNLFEKITVDGNVILKNARPVLKLEHPVSIEMEGNAKIIKNYKIIENYKIIKNYFGDIEKITIEEAGNLQVTLKYEGIHRSLDNEAKIPFIIRMSVGRNLYDIKFVHTFLYDGDENKDFLKGIGISFEKVMKGELYNRHIKIMGDYGFFHEAIVPMISWRPSVPKGIYERQMGKEPFIPTDSERKIIEQIVKDSPHWSEYNLCQDSPSHFLIKKKLEGENLCYIDCLHGNRTNGGCAIGSENGSIIMSIRDFWEKYPSGYSVKKLDSDSAICTIWLYSPEVQAYDFRHYANRGYSQVCYEGYDYKGADPVGIACTRECAINISKEWIPEDRQITYFCEAVNNPIVYVGTPEFYHEMKAFGYWSLPSENTEVEEWFETQLEKAFEFYKNEVEQRNWYGIMNYGDFMHTYDNVRHQWRYDIGGFAWDNTELVPTLWLWLYFMRSGREDVFRLAEKLSRHTSEVDVYHFGRYKGLGSRHNVRHWGCPCKEARIAMASHHRILYYLTGDRRLEDIFDELKDNELSFYDKDPLGDFYDKANMVFPSHARSGPDWSSLCSNWMTQWERTNDNNYRDKIIIGLKDIKNAPLQLSSGPDFEFDPQSLHLRYIGERTTGGCHLQICMGAPQIWLELADLLDDEEFKDMLAKHGRFYYLPHEEQLIESNGLIGDREATFPYMNSALAAYGAIRLKLPWLATKTWKVLLQALLIENNCKGFDADLIENSGNHKFLSEISWISTNFTAQWCLNVIMALEFIRNFLPNTLEELKN